jgi:hypothetical protein
MRCMLAELVLIGFTVSACSSPSVPSWAVASSYQHIQRADLVSRAPPQTAITSGPSTGLSEPDTHKQRRLKAEDANADDGTSTTSGLGDPNPFKELDRRQEEERRRMKAFITICSTC